MIRSISTLIIVMTTLATTSACRSVKPYQRVYLNDQHMRLGHPGIARFEEEVHGIREGASGAGSGKASGGCGCN